MTDCTSCGQIENAIWSAQLCQHIQQCIFMVGIAIQGRQAVVHLFDAHNDMLTPL